MSVKTDKTKAVTLHTHTHTHTQSPPHLFPLLFLSTLLCFHFWLFLSASPRTCPVSSADDKKQLTASASVWPLLEMRGCPSSCTSSFPFAPPLPCCYPHLGSSSLPAPQRDTCVGCVRIWSGPEAHLPALFPYSPYSPPVPLMAMANKSLTECLMCERPRAASPEAVMGMTTAWLSGKLPLPLLHPLQLTLCSALPFSFPSPSHSLLCQATTLIYGGFRLGAGHLTQHTHVSSRFLSFRYVLWFVFGYSKNIILLFAFYTL